MDQKFPSRQWSCGDLVLGAAMVVDNMSGAATAGAIATEKDMVEDVAADLDVESLQRLLKELQYFRFSINAISKIFLHLFFQGVGIPLLARKRKMRLLHTVSVLKLRK